MAEVEPQPAGRHQRTRLTGVLAEHLLQRPVHDVRGGVGARGRLTASRVDRGVGDLARADLPGLDGPHVHRGVPAGRHGVGDANHAGVGADQALVPHLTAALRVERRAVEEHAHGLALFGGLELFGAVVQDQRDRRFGLGLVVADELGGRDGARFETDLDLLACRTRSVALFLEQLGEPVGVDRESGLGRPFLDLFARIPNVSDSANASSPEIREPSARPLASSKSTSPLPRVAENRSSSESATWRTNASFSRSSG